MPAIGECYQKGSFARQGNESERSEEEGHSQHVPRAAVKRYKKGS